MEIPVRTTQLAIKYLRRCIPSGRAEENELHDLIDILQKALDDRKRKP